MIISYGRTGVVIRSDHEKENMTVLLEHLNYKLLERKVDVVVIQKDPGRFVKYSRQEGRKIRLGRMLLKVRWVRRMRDRKKFPIK